MGLQGDGRAAPVGRQVVEGFFYGDLAGAQGQVVVGIPVVVVQMQVADDRGKNRLCIQIRRL